MRREPELTPSGRVRVGVVRKRAVVRTKRMNLGRQPGGSRLGKPRIALVPVIKGRIFVKLRGALAAVAALSLVAAPTVASAAPVAHASAPAVTPASESVTGEDALRGGHGSGVLIGVLAFVLIITGIVIAVKKNDRPNSP